MNYFEFYDLPVTLKIDAIALKKQYIALSKKYHPDFFTQATPEEQAQVLEMASRNNEAYKVLSNRESRIQYVLELSGQWQEGSQTLPQEFLMEMMDINEALMDLEFDADATKVATVKALVLGLEEELESNVSPILEKPAEMGLSDDDLKKIKEYFLKHKYLLRIKENLSKFAPLK